MTLHSMMLKLGQQAQNAAKTLALMPTEQKNNALKAMAKAIEQAKPKLLTINQREVARAKSLQISDAFIDRLTLTNAGIDAMVTGVRAIAELADPVGRHLAKWSVPSGLNITRVAIPLGVIGVIYESRPNVTADAAALCFKAGNAVILRGGSECVETNRAIVDCIQQGLKAADCPKESIQIVPTQDRQAVGELLNMSEYVDVIVPRGGKSLIKRVIAESKVPLFQHLEGICHTYIHQDANFEMAMKVTLNAKLRRSGICGATETLLVDSAIADEFLPDIIAALNDAECEVRGDETVVSLDASVKPASKEDWSTEYLDKVISIRVVADIEHAINHINKYGSNHTEAIISDNNEVADYFMRAINSSIVMHNTSTQFADGGEFGMGAEIGISTGKMYARGPVGVEQLTTFKYLVAGQGQVRS